MRKTCTKCGREGHNAKTCDQPGFPLQRLIESTGRSLAETAKEIDFSRGAFSMAARGQTALGEAAIARLARVIRKPFADVLAAYRAGRRIYLQEQLENMDAGHRGRR